MAELIKKETTEVSQTVEKPDTLSSLFEERDRLPLQEDASPGKHQKQAAPTLSSLEQSELPEPSKIELETEAAKVDDQGINTPDLKTLQAELEKTRKTIAENQKYGRQNAQRLKSALKLAKEMVENGTLSQSEAQSLLVSLENGEIEAEPRALDNSDSHPFANVLKIANTELLSLRKYSDDELLDEKVKAFGFFLSVAPQAEIAEAFEELNDLIEDPVKLAKQMLAIGKRYYDESYKDISSAGGIQQYIKSKQQEIEKLNKSIDKLTKKLSQYEDYDQPRYRINEMGESNEPPPSRDPSSDVFNKRDRDDIRRQKRLA